MNGAGPAAEAVRRALARFDGREPPRTREAALRGRAFTGVPIAASTGGYDRAALQVCACRAVEAACRAEVPAPVEALRRLWCCASWIEGHAAQIFGVQAPALLRCENREELLHRQPAAVARGFALEQTARAIACAVGGATGPAARVGGLEHAPDPAALHALTPHVHEALDDALATVGWVSGFDFPDSALDIPLFALDDPVHGGPGRGRARYPIDDGVGVLATNGLGFPLQDFEAFIMRPRPVRAEAARAVLRGAKAALTGPLARNALTHQRLHPFARSAARGAGLDADERNPHRVVLIRAVELIHALEEALALIEHYEPPNRAHVEVVPRAGRGIAAAEAPSGLLYQRYDLRADGTVTAVRMFGPAELNRGAVELDLRRAARAALRREPALDEVRMARLCARLADNYGLRGEGAAAARPASGA